METRSAGLVIMLVIVGLLTIALVDTYIGVNVPAPNAPTWHCIEGGEDVGFARMCEVDNCHVLFIGDDVLMECGR